MFNTILFPTDLSKASSKVVPYVKEMASKFDAEIHILYVTHVRHYYSSIELQTGYIDEFENQISAIAKKKLNALSEDFKDFSIKTKLLRGHPSQEIIEYTKSNNIDLVIMGHSSTGIERAILGSVAGHVVKYSPVPVLVISPEIIED